MKKTAFPAWIRQFGVKKFVLLSIFALVVLTYIVTPLIALACGGDNNGGGGGAASSDANAGKKDKTKVRPTPRPSTGNTTLIDTGIFLVSNQSIRKTNIAFLQVVGPDHKALTLSQYQQLVQYAATPGRAAVQVRVEIALFNQPILNGVFTQGQFLTQLVGNKPIGEIVVTTDNKQKLIASPTTPIPLRTPGSTAQQKVNGTRRTQ